MGVRRVQINARQISRFLEQGGRLSPPLVMVRDVAVLEARFDSRRGCVEILIESPSFLGTGSDGRWPQIAEGKWDEFPIFDPVFTRRPGSALQRDSSTPSDPDDRHGEIEGA